MLSKSGSEDSRPSATCYFRMLLFVHFVLYVMCFDSKLQLGWWRRKMRSVSAVLIYILSPHFLFCSFTRLPISELADRVSLPPKAHQPLRLLVN